MTASKPAAETEAGFTRAVIDLARVLGWRVWHPRPARTARGWRSAGSGDVGCPDLILARRRVVPGHAAAGGDTVEHKVLLVELKAERGTLGPGQKEWGEAIGPGYRLWRPADWPQIVAELA